METIELNLNPQVCAQKLEAYFKAQGHAIIAYSGGVDSALMAYAAHRIRQRQKCVSTQASSS